MMGLLRFLNPFRRPPEMGGMAGLVLRRAGALTPDDGPPPDDAPESVPSGTLSSARAHGRAAWLGFAATVLTTAGSMALYLTTRDPLRSGGGLCFALMFLLSALASRKHRRRLEQATIESQETVHGDAR